MEMYNYQIIAKDFLNEEEGYTDTLFYMQDKSAQLILTHLVFIAQKHGVNLEGIFSELHLVSILNEYDNINVELLQLNNEGSLEPMDF